MSTALAWCVRAPQEKPFTPASRIGLTSRAGAPAGGGISTGSSPAVSSLSTRRGRRRTWRPCAAGAARPLADDDVPGRTAPRSHRGTLRVRWSDQRRELPRLSRAERRANARARRHRRHGQSREPQERGHPHRDPRGARLVFLPPYSPDLNPVDQVFAKLKTLLRKAEERTVEGVWRCIGSLLERFTPIECGNYFRNAGYASS